MQNVKSQTFRQKLIKWPFYLKYFNPFPNKPLFLRVCSAHILKTLWENEKLLVTSTGIHRVLYAFGDLSAILIKFKIFVCKFFEFGSLKICRFGKS